jgi:hypothetical protein
MVFALGMALPMFAQKANEDGTNSAQLQESATKRDPFWPVGYKPKNIMKVVATGDSFPKVQVVEKSWDEAMKKVAINGVSTRAGNEYFAVINGEVRSVGDTVKVSYGDSTYTWAVDAIESSGSVKLRRVSVR